MEFKHISVLLDECIDSLDIKPDGVYVDGTVGGAGHSKEIAKRLSPNGRLICIDQDAEAVNKAKEVLKNCECEITIVKDNYLNIKRILDELSIGKVDGILLDLGVSSYQLDNAERGFSFNKNARLDMRMDTDKQRSAYDIVNEYSKTELARVIKIYGEEKFANNIAKHIVNDRKVKPIETTFDLVESIRKAIPMKVQKTMGHPAKRVFQAIRIELNEELDVLRKGLDDMVDVLDDGGRLSVITFHSLEDRIVKRQFKRYEDPCTCPRDFPVCMCGNVSKGNIYNRKAILPSDEEKEKNSRSKSAKLRVFNRTLGDGYEKGTS